VQLWRTEEDHQISRFAARCGVLDLNQEGLPISDVERWQAIIGRRELPQIGSESVTAWRDYSITLSAFLSVAASLHVDQRPKLEDLQRPLHPDSVQLSVEDARNQLHLMMNELVLWSNLRPALQGRDSGPPSIVLAAFEFGGLYDVLRLS
jgi:hypothetical protein